MTAKRRCTSCRKAKPTDEFYVHAKSGMDRQCKRCCNEARLVRANGLLRRRVQFIEDAAKFIDSVIPLLPPAYRGKASRLLDQKP